MEYLPLVNDTEKTISPATLLVREPMPLDSEAVIFTRWTTCRNVRLLISICGEFFEKIRLRADRVDLARVAIALERYRLAHGEFPDSLDALAPQFIAKVPHDVIGGQPLKYRRTSDGQFVLYSVGWNETDDGGVVVSRKSRDPRDEVGNSPDISQGDWVWRYPRK